MGGGSGGSKRRPGARAPVAAHVYGHDVQRRCDGGGGGPVRVRRAGGPHPRHLHGSIAVCMTLRPYMKRIRVCTRSRVAHGCGAYGKRMFTSRAAAYVAQRAAGRRSELREARAALDGHLRRAAP